MTEKKKSRWRNIIAHAITVLAVFLLALIFPVNCFAEDYSAVVTLANDKNSDIYVEVTRHSGGKHDWQEYGYSIKNNSGQVVNGVTISIPTNGSVTSFKCWGISAKYSNGNIVISYTKALKPGESVVCTSDQKFGYSGGGLLSTPSVTAGGEGTSTSGLKYMVTGSVKNLKFSETPVGKHGALSVAKVEDYVAPTIVDECGNAVQLRTASTHGVQWFPAYVNKAGFQSLRDEWGMNAVRLAIYPREGGYLQGSQSLMDSKIQEGVKAAKELGMYIIIDWHVLNYNPNEDIDAAKTFFKKYATMYKAYDNVIFEICNEPTGTTWYNGSGNDLYTYCKEVCKTIRDCGNDSIIICGTNDWSQRVDEVATKPLKDDGFKNIMYSIHFYAATHYDNIKNNVKSAIASGTPVFCTEFGVCDASGNGGYDFENADDWMKLFKKNNISYACWSLCNKAESASYLDSSSSKTSAWTESDLSETGVWLINTSRALADEAPNSTGSAVVPSEPETPEMPETEESKVPETEEKPEMEESKVPETEETFEPESPENTTTEGCNASLTIGSQWDTGLVVNAVVKNNSKNIISGWTVEFDFEGEITNIWCAKVVSHSGNHYVVEAESYNKNINANGQASFGFNATKKKAGQKVSITNVSVK